MSSTNNINQTPGACPEGNTGVSPLTRRRFLTFAGVGAAATLGVGATQARWSDLMTAADERQLDPTQGIVVVVTLYGGNDGLNTVISASDATYQSARADLAYQPEEVLDLGEGLGLNPGMTGLHRQWDQGKLAIVRGVGYPEANRSHFLSMAIWQTAAPKTPTPSGWLGRWLDTSSTDPLAALSLDPLLAPLMAGETTAAVSFPLGGLKLPKGPLTGALAQGGKPSADDGPWQSQAAESMATLTDVAKTLNPVLNRPPPSSDPTEPQDKGSSAGGQSGLAAQLDLVATFVEMGLPTRAYSVSLGGFDTHSDARSTQQRLLTQLDQALTRFQTRLDRTDRGRQVVTMVYSEFGRRVTANASDGTDHGTAGPLFVLGRGVQGGFFGEEPSLTDLDNGDLKASTDFRSVYGSVLQHVLDTEPGKILPGFNGEVEGLLR